MKKLVIAIALIGCQMVVYSQGRNPERREQIEAQRSAYITSRVGLSADESRSFWPVYNKMRDELDANRENYLKVIRPRVPMDSRSDAEIKEAMEARFKMEEDRLRIERRYQQEFLKVLSIRQLGKLYQAEEEFKKEVLKELRRR